MKERTQEDDPMLTENFLEDEHTTQQRTAGYKRMKQRGARGK
jgi:hypothetical protein